MNTHITNDPILRPTTFLAGISRYYKNIWWEVDRMRAARGQFVKDWPGWCFLPLGGAYAIAGRGGTIALENISLVGIIGALAAWRATQGVYRFDPTILDALWETPVDGNIPHELLFRLPEWCPYVLTPGKSFAGLPLHGFFTHLEYDNFNGGRIELRFLLDITTPHGEELVPAVLHLVPGGLAEAIAAVRRECLRLTGCEKNICADIVSTIGDTFSLALSPAGFPVRGDALREFSPLVSTVLYLCSQAAEMHDHSGSIRLPARPTPVKTRKGLRLFGPPRPVEWHVAYRLGAALRLAYAAEEHSLGGTGTGHASPRPHIRRGHWHRFWTGRRSIQSERRTVVKWLPPIAVCVDDVEQLVPTVRAVA